MTIIFGRSHTNVVSTGVTMAVLTIKIPDLEMAMLDAMVKTQRRTKTEIVRSVLRPVFEENFVDKRPLTIAEDEFNAILDMLEQPISAEEIEGRKRLEARRLWELPE